MEVRPEKHADVINSWIWVRLTSLSTKKGLERKFTTEGGGGRPPSDLKFTTPSQCEVFSGGLRVSPTHQLGKGDLKAKSGFPDAAGSHPI